MCSGRHSLTNYSVTPIAIYVTALSPNPTRHIDGPPQNQSGMIQLPCFYWPRQTHLIYFCLMICQNIFSHNRYLYIKC